MTTRRHPRPTGLAPQPQSRSPFLPPVLPKQKVLEPLPARRHFYDGYSRGHWAALIVGLAVLAVIFGPAYLAILELFK